MLSPDSPLKRGTPPIILALTLATANLELMPELSVVLVGWKKQIVDQPWQIAGAVVHKLERGLTTAVSLNLGNQ